MRELIPLIEIKGTLNGDGARITIKEEEHKDQNIWVENSQLKALHSIIGEYIEASNSIKSTNDEVEVG